MFRLLTVFVLICHLSLTTSSLLCGTCNQTMKLTTSETINTTTCRQSLTPTNICTAVLTVDSQTNNATVTFGGDSGAYTNSLKNTTMIKHRMVIMLNNNVYHRTLQLFCSKNNSCLTDMKEIYDKSKTLNYTALQASLKSQLYNAEVPNDNLACANNNDQQIPCPNGCCELNSNGNSGFNRRCIEGSCSYNPIVEIESQVIGQTDAESTFRYQCNRPMCNNKENADKVRDLLKQDGLLTSTGTVSALSNTAMIVINQSSSVTQCLLMITILLFSKYY